MLKRSSNRAVVRCSKYRHVCIDFSNGTAIPRAVTRYLYGQIRRIFHLHAILAARRTPIPLEDLTARLECFQGNASSRHQRALGYFARAGGF